MDLPQAFLHPGPYILHVLGIDNTSKYIQYVNMGDDGNNLKATTNHLQKQ